VDVDEFNTRLLDCFSGEERVYHSADFADEMVKDTIPYRISSSMISLPSPTPTHPKLGLILMVLRNLDPHHVCAMDKVRLMI